MPENTAAWQPKGDLPLEVRSAPYTQPKDNEIVVRNRALAINPVDWMIQKCGDLLFTWLKYPFILGEDLAGEVAEVGQAVTRFKVGDRVLGQAVGSDPKENKLSGNAFQTYTILYENMASPIPDSMSFEEACVIPLGFGTAACGLFEDGQLALQYPTTSPKTTGKTVLIWGGSTSVGCNAIQLARAAGYNVITTCSPRNFELVKELGASLAFDYNSTTTIDDIVRAMKGEKMAGALAIGHRSYFGCLDVLGRCAGDKKLSIATYPSPPAIPEQFRMPKFVYYYLTGSIQIWLKSKMKGIHVGFIFGSSLAANAVGKAVYADYLPQALADGTFVAAPKPKVVGTGLESLQAAYDIQAKGVSAEKIVVTL